MEEKSQYAIIEAGGRQYTVSVGQRIRINRINGYEDGSEFIVNEVLAVGDGAGGLTIGTPFVPGATVNFKVVGDCRGRKVVAFKRRRRKGYCRKIGHRQDLTELLVEGINTK